MMSMRLAPDAIKSLENLANSENQPLLQGLLKGIEKEGLRVTANGALALTPHPASLGSALTHPLITTDFSESLLEFITPPSHIGQQTVNELRNLHAYSYNNLNNEYIWPLSMPCILPDDQHIPVAQYGTSNRALMKTIYREGLGLRYGRTMQTVAGLHYNFSLPRSFWAYLHQQEQSLECFDTYITAKYFHLIRNFRRYYWLLIYLFGASPVVDPSFVKGRQHSLLPVAKKSLGLPFATALRMGNLGYQSSAQSSLFVCYNALNTYTKTLSKAIRTPYEAYKNLEHNGNRQLNKSLLQIENEFYSPIRPKRAAHAGETALTALCKRGVEYLEVRCMDLDPFSPAGITRETMRFLDAFLLYCLFLPNDGCDENEFTHTANNQKSVVTEGRKPNLLLTGTDQQPIELKKWGLFIIEGMAAVADTLNQTSNSIDGYTQALNSAKAKLEAPELTPSGKIMAQLENQNLSHVEFGLLMAKQHAEELQKTALNNAHQKRYEDMTEESLRLQHEEETQAQLPFDEYLKAYYRQYSDCCAE